jgi:DNA/RNA non-specific endonuclease
MNKLTKSIVILAGAIALTGCGQIHPTGYQKLPQVKQEVKDKSKSAYEAAKEKVKEFKEKHSKNEVSSNTAETNSDYDESKFPDMYEVLGEAEIDESKFSTTYSYSYDNLDRTTTAYGLINYKAVMDSKGWRAEFEPNSEPSGWWKLDTNGKIVMKGKKRVSNNEEVKVKLPTGKIYSGYFYNRSHLIADSLGGRSYKYNVVTGTRQQNVGNNGDGGMQYIEKKVKDYVEQTKNNVYYEVTPVYNGNELVPRYVIVNAKSEDGVINEKVKVFNNASGYEINYSDGSFTKK